MENKQDIEYEFLQIFSRFYKCINMLHVPLSLLMQVSGMSTAQSPTLQDWAKGWAEFSMIPLVVVKSSVVSLLLLPQSPERQTGYDYQSNWIVPESSRDN